MSARWSPANPAAVPKIIDITFPRGQARLSGHFFLFPTIRESRALPPFPLHVSPGVSLEEKRCMFRVKGGRWRCSLSRSPHELLTHDSLAVNRESTRSSFVCGVVHYTHQIGFNQIKELETYLLEFSESL